MRFKRLCLSPEGGGGGGEPPTIEKVLADLEAARAENTKLTSQYNALVVQNYELIMRDSVPPTGDKKEPEIKNLRDVLNDTSTLLEKKEGK